VVRIRQDSYRGRNYSGSVAHHDYKAASRIGNPNVVKIALIRLVFAAKTNVESMKSHRNDVQVNSAIGISFWRSSDAAGSCDTARAMLNLLNLQTKCPKSRGNANAGIALVQNPRS